MPNTPRQRRLYRELVGTNVPFVGRWIIRRAAEGLVRDGAPEAAAMLAQALLFHPSGPVAESALEAMRRMQNERCINAVCKVWVESRHLSYKGADVLGKLVVEMGWVAVSSVQVRLLTALKVGKRDRITGLGAKVVKPLLEACGDKDSQIAEQAALALGELHGPGSEDALCEAYLNEEHPALRAAVSKLECGLRDESQRALFYFLTEQWDKYESFDFDHRHVRAVYDGADAALRQRIADRLRSSGRADFLTIAVGGGVRQRRGVMSHAEAESLVQAVTTNRDWPKLWEMVFEAPLSSSVRAVQTLSHNGWEPDSLEEKRVLKQLVSLITDEMSRPWQELAASVPPAVRRAHITVAGRVNAAALSPTEPVLAIGTGIGRVVLWNYHKASREQVLKGFGHSVGTVAFTGDGSLICAEKSSSNDRSCGVYGWRGDQTFPLGQHIGTVSTIERVGSSQALTAGRDCRVVLWDVGERRAVADREFRDWARVICVLPDKNHASLHHHGIDLVRLPDLEVVAGRKSRYVMDCAACVPGENAVLGRDYVNLAVWRRMGDSLRAEDVSFGEDIYAFQLRTIPNRPVTAAVTAVGQLMFLSWETRSVIGSLDVRTYSPTSLRVSPDGKLMAVGGSDASVTLWDLRPLGLSLLPTRPYSQFTPADLKDIIEFAGDKELPEAMRQALRYSECVLKHRFRFDVQIDESPLIQSGEFDIEVE